MKHSEEKQTFETGAQRDTQEGKPRIDLISPVFLERLGMVLTKGAEHYGERNWEKGMPLSRILASASRHLNQTIDGLEDEDHPAQCAWNIMAYIHTLHRIRAGSLPAELDDLPREMNLGKKNLKTDLTSTEKSPTVESVQESFGWCNQCNGGVDRKLATLNRGRCPDCGGKIEVYNENR